LFIIIRRKLYAIFLPKIKIAVAFIIFDIIYLNNLKL